MTSLRWRLVLLVVALSVVVTRGQGRVAVGENAPALERFAAEELWGYLGSCLG